MSRLVVVKDKIWPSIGYNPHVGQRLVHASLARNRVNAAGRRFGKSQVGGHELMPEVVRAKVNLSFLEDMGIRQEYWIVGPNYTDAEKEFRVFYNDCKRLKLPFDRPGTYNDTRSGNMQISLFEGRFLVQAKSAAHPESLVGEGLHGVIMAEAAKMKESVWSKFVRPTLADFRGWSLWNSTPEGKNYFYELWQMGQDPANVNWDSWRQPSWMNHFVFRQGVNEEQYWLLKGDGGNKPPRPDLAVAAGMDSEVAALYDELGPVLFSQEVECSFSEYAGRVYYDFDEQTHVKSLEYNPSLPVYLATDYGYTNPNVMLFIQVDYWKNVYVIAEYYMRGRTEDEFVHDILDNPRLAALSRVASMLFPDPEDPGATATLCRGLGVTKRGSTGGLLKDRIRLIRNHLKVTNTHLPFGHPDRAPKMFFDRSCTETIREMDAYRYPDIKVSGENRENPMKKDDHAPEALSRFFGGYFGASARGTGTRVRKARVG